MAELAIPEKLSNVIQSEDHQETEEVKTREILKQGNEYMVKVICFHNLPR